MPVQFFWGVYDAVSAAVVHEADGDGLWLSGLCCSAALGLPDTELAGLGDLLAGVRAVRRVSGLPLWVDCGTGFGSPANLAVAAGELRQAGADGVCFEDKVFPKRNTFAPVAHTLEEVSRFCEKIERAKERLAGCDGLVIARTEALAVGEPLAACLERAAAYADAGADLLFLSNPSRSAAGVLGFLAGWQGRLPVVLLPTSYRLGNVAEFERLGVTVAIFANQLLRSSVAAMRHLLARYQDDPASATDHEPMISVAELLQLADRRIS